MPRPWNVISRDELVPGPAREAKALGAAAAEALTQSRYTD